MKNINGTNNPNFKWTNSKLKEIASTYKSKSEFMAKNSKAYSTAYRIGILNEICKHMKRPLKIKWTENKLAEEALKYKTRYDFQKKSNSAYVIAQRSGILDTICAHMTNIRNSWTKESILNEAKKYEFRSAFVKHSNDAYQAAKRGKILGEVDKCFKKCSGSSFLEKNIFDLVKDKFPKAQKLRDRKVSIKDKPLIVGFDIDIYIPELRKGIEFDGEYWHSVQGLKRSRGNWPMQDLVEYHEIKDNYFKSKNISIFHVNEKDWLSNKQKCLDNIWKFLEA